MTSGLGSVRTAGRRLQVGVGTVEVTSFPKVLQVTEIQMPPGAILVHI